MIGYRFGLAAAGAALLIAAAPAAVAYAVSDNSIEYSVSDNEVIVDVMEGQTGDQQADPDPDESGLYWGDSFTLSDNNFSPEEKSELSADYGSFEDDEIYPVMPLANYDTYYGSISTTYVEYFRGYLAKLQPTDHYVAARTGQYEYIFAYGGELSFDGSFYGSDVYVVKFNTQNNGTFSGGIEPTFTLDPGSHLVYSDLSAAYPSLATSADISLRQIVFVAGIVIVFYTLTKFMQPGIVKSHSRRWIR